MEHRRGCGRGRRGCDGGQGARHPSYDKGHETAFVTSSATPTMDNWVDHTLTATPLEDPCRWYIDSGASQHMTAHWALFSIYTEIPPIPVATTNGELHAIATGSIRISLQVGNGVDQGVLYDVLHVPHLSKNLFSVGAAATQGHFNHLQQQHLHPVLSKWHLCRICLSTWWPILSLHERRHPNPNPNSLLLLTPNFGTNAWATSATSVFN